MVQAGDLTHEPDLRARFALGKLELKFQEQPCQRHLDFVNCEISAGASLISVPKPEGALVYLAGDELGEILSTARMPLVIVPHWIPRIRIGMNFRVRNMM